MTVAPIPTVIATGAAATEVTPRAVALSIPTVALVVAPVPKAIAAVLAPIAPPAAAWVKMEVPVDVITVVAIGVDVVVSSPYF